MSSRFAKSVLWMWVSLWLACLASTGYAQGSAYSYTLINVPESLRVLDCFPSRNAPHTLTSADGVSLDALIWAVDFAAGEAQIVVDGKRYTMSLAQFDDASRQTIWDWGIKNALNRNLSLAAAEHNRHVVRIDESRPFRLQDPPAGGRWASVGLRSRYRNVGFLLRSSLPMDIEGVDVLIGVRTRRTMRRDDSRLYPRDSVAGRYFVFDNLRSQTIKGLSDNEFLSQNIVHSFASNRFTGPNMAGFVEFDDDFDSYYILLLYKGEMVFGAIRNTASVSVATAHLNRFLASEANPEFEIITR